MFPIDVGMLPPVAREFKRSRVTCSPEHTTAVHSHIGISGMVPEHDQPRDKDGLISRALTKSHRAMCCGSDVGIADGVAVGFVVGLMLGSPLGSAVGLIDGRKVGTELGPFVGSNEGKLVGSDDGVSEGMPEGNPEGA